MRGSLMSCVTVPTVSATIEWIKPEERAMKKHLQLAVSLSALVAYAAIVCVGYFHARAEIADEACGVDCLVQQVDALTKKD
jgi:nucleoside recognition membrane protein YjiH